MGYTRREISERVCDHFSGQGSIWTKLFKPKMLLYYDEGTQQDENDLTLKMMSEFGFYNVRGGKYTAEEINFIPEQILNKLEEKYFREIKECVQKVKVYKVS